MNKHQYSPEQAFLRAEQCQKRGKYLEVKVYALMVSVEDNPLNVDDAMASQFYAKKLNQLLLSCKESHTVKMKNKLKMSENMKEFIRSFCDPWLNQGPNSVKQQMKVCEFISMYTDTN